MVKKKGMIPAYPLQGLKLLMSDDEPKLRQIIVLMAEELGADVIPVESNDRAMELYREKGDEIDLVMLDLRMKGTDGITALDELRKIDPEVKVVISSGIKPDPPIMKKLKRNGYSFIEKPFDIDHLSEVLHHLSQA